MVNSATISDFYILISVSHSNFKWEKTWYFGIYNVLMDFSSTFNYKMHSVDRISAKNIILDFKYELEVGTPI